MQEIININKDIERIDNDMESRIANMTPAGCKVYKCGCIHNLAVNKWNMCPEHEYVIKRVIRDFEQDMIIKGMVVDLKNKIKNIINYIVDVNKKVVNAVKF